MKPAWPLLAVLVLAAPASAPDAQPSGDAFLHALGSLCGHSYAGRVTASDPKGDLARFGEHVMVMHVARCTDAQVHMPFDVGDERARALVVEAIGGRLHLKHEHEGADGMPDMLSDFGGVSIGGGAFRREFKPDRDTVELLQAAGVPRAHANRWILDLRPGETLRYELVRDAQRVVIEFDLMNPVELPETPLELRARLAGDF